MYLQHYGGVNSLYHNEVPSNIWAISSLDCKHVKDVSLEYIPVSNLEDQEKSESIASCINILIE